jgi:hypothetical protein
LGLSFAHRGRPQAAVAASASSVAAAEWANIRSRSSTLGHETLTSTATTSGGAPASIAAALPNSSTVRPQMLATTRAPDSTSGGRSSSSHASTPGPARPTLFSIPAPASWTRGAGLPAHGPGDSDFTTTAPSDDRSR